MDVVLPRFPALARAMAHPLPSQSQNIVTAQRRDAARAPSDRLSSVFVGGTALAAPPHDDCRAPEALVVDVREEEDTKIGEKKVSIIDEELGTKEASSTKGRPSATSSSALRWKATRRRIKKVLNSATVSTWMALITTWSLFGDDIRMLATNIEADPWFLSMVYVCLASFGTELVVSALAYEGYLFGFYFWLDFIATASLLADIPLFLEAVGMNVCVGATDSYGSNFDNVYVSLSASGMDGIDGGFARAGRASRAATRAGRIVRILRLIRLLKTFKPYETSLLRKQGSSKTAIKQELIKPPPSMNAPSKADDMDNNEDNEDDEHDEDDPLADYELSNSRVGQKLGDLTTKRVIVGVLLMLFTLPLFDVTLYDVGTSTSLAAGGIDMAHEMLVNIDTSSSAMNGFYHAVNQYHAKTVGMYRLVVNGTSYENDANLDFTLDGYSHKRLRCEEFEFAFYYPPYMNDEHNSPSFVFFDRQLARKAQAILNMMRTSFVCIILLVGAILFNKDANTLVLRPLDRMVMKIQVMSENPLTQFTISHDDDDNQMETRMLENSISRICSLLAVGFGDAGSEIIAENMKRGGAIDPMIPGKKMTAVFGFCDIRQFTDTTEILQEDIMEFVNTIAKIVHVEVHLHGGSANKNIGDAFLLVWKFPKTIFPDDISSSSSLVDDKRRDVETVADKALASFITIIGALRRSARLHRYRGNKALNERIANFEVKMGFGLHVGWAIEGAIGSEHKVDASYLSPNVNISARLEAATKQFGVPLLFTGEFADLLSPKVRKLCRQIDCVTVKGSLHPVKLYTFDVRVDNIDPPGKDVSLLRTFEEETMSLEEYKYEFEEHPDIVTLRQGVSEDFLIEFNRGLQHYINGDWRLASSILQRTRTVVNKFGTPMSDGPSESLLKVMQSHDYNAPRGWRGFRELTEK